MSITPAIRGRVLERDHFKCRRCGASAEAILHVDHIVPKSRGGTDDIDNLQTLCRDCNLGKRDRPPHAADLRTQREAAKVVPGLIGWFAFGRPGKPPTEEDLGWQVHVVDEVAGKYLVQRFSWIDGSPTSAVFVTPEDMSEWEFFDTREAWLEYAEKIQTQNRQRRKEEREWERERMRSLSSSDGAP